VRKRFNMVDSSIACFVNDMSTARRAFRAAEPTAIVLGPTP
jgi:hypothetical protein